MADIPIDFVRLVDAIIAAGHTCETVLVRLDQRLAGTPPGEGRDRLTAFRQGLADKIAAAKGV